MLILFILSKVTELLRRYRIKCIVREEKKKKSNSSAGIERARNTTPSVPLNKGGYGGCSLF